MSAFKPWILICDHCGKEFPAPALNTTLKDLRKLAKDTAKWKQRGTKDFCCSYCSNAKKTRR